MPEPETWNGNTRSILNFGLLYSHTDSTEHGKNDTCEKITFVFEIATVSRLPMLKETEEVVRVGPDCSQ